MELPAADELADLLRYADPEDRALLEKAYQQASEILPESLMEYIPAVTPTLVAPRHLHQIVDLIEYATTHRVEAVISAPPQHGKTSVIAHSIPWMMQRTTKRHAYVSYNEKRGHEISREMQAIADRARLPWHGNLALWGTGNGSQIAATGIGGGLTGRPVDGVALVDDPVKGRKEADSVTIRESTHAWYKSVLVPRRHPGSSALVVMTRWHEDDLGGRLIKAGYDEINLPAINAQDEALWPEQRPRDFLDGQREQMDAREWYALYMGKPRPPDGQLFRGVQFYDRLPEKYRVAIGVDLAYTAKTSADWSIAVVMAEAEGNWYVLDVIRLQCETPRFAKELTDLQVLYPGAPALWYTSTTEKGTADLVRVLGGNLYAKRTHGDKYVRGTPFSVAWNKGKVFVPRKAPWLDAFVRCLHNFTGVGDIQDDDLDAAAAAYDQLPPTFTPEPKPKYGTAEFFKREEEARLRMAIDEARRRRDSAESGSMADPWATPDPLDRGDF